MPKTFSSTSETSIILFRGWIQMESYCKKGPKSTPSKAHTFVNSTESIKITKININIHINPPIYPYSWPFKSQLPAPHSKITQNLAIFADINAPLHNNSQLSLLSPSLIPTVFLPEVLNHSYFVRQYLIFWFWWYRDSSCNRYENLYDFYSTLRNFTRYPNNILLVILCWLWQLSNISVCVLNFCLCKCSYSRYGIWAIG